MKLLMRMLKNEAGQALPMVLILMVLGGLLVVPMLSFMTTNLNAGRVIEGKTEGIYAADAGIADALWKLGNGVDPFPNGATSYDLKDNGTPVTINGMTVTVERLPLDPTKPDLYTLKSTATSTLDDKVKAVITAQAVAGSDFSWLFKHAITSAGSVETKKSDVIYGGILYQGSYDDNADVRSGEVRQGTVNLPTENQLKAFYWDKVKNLSVLPGNYVIPGGTPSSPHMIPSGYSNGNLSITGSGYGKLSGTIYVKGDFSFTDKRSTLDLNGQTIFAEGTAYFKPDSTVRGPGCIIAVGNVDFQPNIGVGNQLLGITDDQDTTTTIQENTFLLSRFKAIASGKLISFQVKCYYTDSDEHKVKVALYADSNGAPGTLLNKVDSDNQTVLAGWNPINFPETQLTQNNYYWMAAISDSPVIVYEPQTSTNKYKYAAYSGFSFPDPAPPASDFTSQTTEQYMLRGYEGSQEFIFIMSVNSTSNVKPGGTFYGSIAGNSSVELLPNCTLNLVGLPEEGLIFPGISGSGSGSGTGGNSPPLLNYNIE
jgi:hypothetical protein